MNILLLFCVCICYIFAIATISYGAVAIIPADDTIGHPGHCNSKITGPLKNGESITIENCTRATCNADGSIQLASCGAFNSPCGKTDPDLTKPYPDCCPQPKIC